uniref:SMP-30/Gluconolaconase/LRE domain protein n=1 Tax=Solibacter usitatus (strain Ellin6076) TaxID=234267 RepID=Q024F0_SOLUE
MLKRILAGLIAAAVLPAASYYTLRLEDSKAVYLTPGDGAADASDTIQQAIDKVQAAAGEGIVFVPEGRYRLTKTVYIPAAIRLIGYGATRPVFVLGPNTPGYQDPANEKYMIFFSGRGRGEAGAGTFYSGMSNIDLEVLAGNAGAVGVRGKYAQHCILAHMDFRIGSGLAGVHETGNVMEDVSFHGGQYGIWTGTPSPGWQLTLVDARFEGQREAAIREKAAGLTLVRPHFRSVPTAISIDAGSHEELWVKDARFEDISGPAVIVSLEENPRTQINIENAVCRRVPVFASLRDSGRQFTAPGEVYAVPVFSHGLRFADIGAAPITSSVFEIEKLTAMPAPVKSDLPDLPSRDSWVNIRSLGAKGDGSSDDTEVFRKAVAAHRAIYLPQGKYVISDTIALRPDTVLIGLHPSATQLVLRDSTAAFQGVGAPKPMIEAPQRGSNIVIGLGLYTNGINPRAVAAKWMAGAGSLMNDVRFLGGHGTSKLEGGRDNPYNNAHSADPDLNRRWDGQYPSLWVTDGGGGTFFDIWTPSTFAQSGMLVSNTATEGRIYQMSSEHHVRYEVQLHNVSNWKVYALQTEEERGEGGFALPLEIQSSSNITVANFHIYRVISSFQPFPYAVKVLNSRDIRFRNIHCYSNSKVSFDSAIYDQTHDSALRQREFAWLTLSGAAPAARTRPASTVLDAAAKVEKLAGGFYNISGGAASPAGDFYFVDAHWQRIYRWSGQLSTVRDNPLDPVNLAFDKAGNLMVVSYAGAGMVYSFKPGSPESEITLLTPQPAAPRPGMIPVLPVSDWRMNPQTLAQPHRQYVSPDGSTFIPAGQDFVSGAMSWGVKSSALLRGFGLAAAAQGKPVYLTSESEVTTWQASLTPAGGMTDFKVFANQGGESVAVDEKGNVYVAAGQIFVYDPAGRLIETIDVPERPLQLVFGGADGKTLFVPARTSLYAVRTKFAGRRAQ